MYPEVKQCLAAFEAAREQYENSPSLAGKHDEKTCPLCAREAAHAAAWDALKASASTPLVRWIAENCADEKSAALKALALLPAPMSALDALAVREDWCGMYGRYRAAAKAAGVLAVMTLGEVAP